MALTDYSGGPYTELDGSRAGSFGSSTGFSRKFKVAWSDQYAFTRALLGYPQFTAGSTFPPSDPGMNRILPDPYPDANWLFCRNADIQPQGVIRNNAYEWVFIDAHYEPLTFPVSGPNAYLSESIDGVTQFITVDNAQLVYDSDNKALPDPPGLPFRGVEYTQVWHEVPDGAINWATLFNNQNKLNNAALAIGIWTQIPLGCMLFLKFEAHNVFPPDGSKAWDLTYHFHLRNQDHNKVLRSDTFAWEWFRWKNGTPASGSNPPGSTLIGYFDMKSIWTWPMP